MIASILTWTLSDIKQLKITDEYSVHREVYDLFDRTRSNEELKSNTTSGILYTDKGGDFHSRKLLILSDRMPNNPKHGIIQTKLIEDKFLSYSVYNFVVTINPTKRDKNSGKTVPIINNKSNINPKEQVMEWFINKTMKSWGFSVDANSLLVNSIDVVKFNKSTDAENKQNHSELTEQHKQLQVVTLCKANLQGTLKVTDQDLFIASFKKGIGRGRAFGCGLLEIIPAI